MLWKTADTTYLSALLKNIIYLDLILDLFTQLS